MEFIEDLGMRYPTKTSKKKRRYGLYECGCGALIEKEVYKPTIMCEQCRVARSVVHGESKSKLYYVWVGMKARCCNHNNKRYEGYGGRGISVCSGWEDYSGFSKWAKENGYADGLSIDRINNDDGYSPHNCRWTSASIQSRNSRRLRATNTSGYRGVTWNKISKKWRAQIGVDSKLVYLGEYEKLLDAAKAYDYFVTENNLEHTTNGLM